MNISYLMISESFNENLSNVDVRINDQLCKLVQVLEMIHDDEIIVYSMDLFDQPIFDRNSFQEWLFNEGEMRDEKRLFQLMFKKMQEIDKTAIHQAITKLQLPDYENPTALITFYKWDCKVENSLLVRNEQDCLNARRFYLKYASDGSIFLDECNFCFPQLYINKRVWQTVKRLKPFRDYVDELILHLTILNDHGQNLFFEYKDQNEIIVLTQLGIIGGIQCSVQGDPAYEKANLCFDFPSDNGGKIKIVCAPHTKLFNKHSGERIYFNWVHPEVKKGDKLLIGHIGEHL